MIKSVFLLAVVLAFSGCEKEFDTVVDNSIPVRTVKTITPISSFVTVEDTAILLSIKPLTIVSGDRYFAEVSTLSGKITGPSPLELFDDGLVSRGDITAGDSVYTNKFPLSATYNNGDYKIEYYIQPAGSAGIKVGTQFFTYLNGQGNAAPVLASIQAPDTLTVTAPMSITLSIAVSDSNGQGDIDAVYFNTYRPNGTTNGITFYMYDNGQAPDVTSGDGRYSAGIVVDQNNLKGTYRFEFRAKDKAKKVSQPFIHFITLK